MLSVNFTLDLSYVIRFRVITLLNLMLKSQTVQHVAPVALRNCAVLITMLNLFFTLMKTKSKLLISGLT